MEKKNKEMIALKFPNFMIISNTWMQESQKHHEHKKYEENDTKEHHKQLKTRYRIKILKGDTKMTSYAEKQK